MVKEGNIVAFLKEEEKKNRSKRSDSSFSSGSVHQFASVKAWDSC